MPLYEFECKKCTKTFEENVKLSEFDTKVVECPDCKEPAQRKISGLRSPSSTWKHWRLGG